MSSKLQTINNTMNIFMSTTNNTNNVVNNMGGTLKSVPESTRSAGEGVDGLATKLRSLAAAAGGIAAIRQAIGISDDLTSMTARLNSVDQSFNGTNANIDAFKSKIYAAANASRGTFDSMASLIARLGNNAGEAFNSTDELIQFATNTQRLMTIAGASTEEASNAMLQMSQALASGVLRGDELNSIFEQAPNLIKVIAESMGVSMGEIRTLASEGKITAEVVKSALIGATDDIQAQFDAMPMTFGQSMSSIQNYALQAFTPVLNQMNSMLNSDMGQTLSTNAMHAIATAASVASDALTLFGSAVQFVMDNFNAITPVLALAVGSYTAYNLVLTAGSVLSAVHSAAVTVATACMAAYANRTQGAAASLAAFNGVMAACPVTWLMVAIVAVVAAVGLLAQRIASAGGTAQSAFAVICGWVSVALSWFVTLGSNIGTAITNGCAIAQVAFYALMYAAMSCISAIANALNAIPGISFDTSGLESAANDYAQKANAANLKIKDFKEFDAKAAYDKGANWGNEKLNAFKNIGDTSGAAAAANAANSAANATADNTAKTADNTKSSAGSSKSINDKLDDTEEDLKYLCDIAERDAINKFTTASISVDMVNNNSISSALDLDTIVDGLAGQLQTSMAMVAEGV